MNAQILEVLSAIREAYGDGAFYNSTAIRNLLSDLAPGMQKERVQIVNFLDIGGYFQLKHAQGNYPVIRANLIQQMIEKYAISPSAANWVLNVFSLFLGYEIDAVGDVKIPEIKKHPAPKVTKRTLMNITPPPPKTRTLSAIRTKIAASEHSVAVTRAGHVVAAGINSDGQCHTDSYDWRDIVAVAAGVHYTVGLRRDLTVVGAGRYEFGQRDFASWTDIVAISAGERHTVGRRDDGSLMAAGYDKTGATKVTHWRNIAHVIAGGDVTFGIKKDGKVLVAGNNRAGNLQVSHLQGVIDIAYGTPGRIVALLKDGTVDRVGRDNYMRKTFSQHRDIIQISAAPDYIAGLKDNGTVHLLAYFWKDSGVEAAVHHWKNIIAIAAGRYHILGLQSDGRVVAELLHHDIAKNKGQLSVGRWEV